MRVAFTTLGCRLNQFETEGMRRRVDSMPTSEIVEWEDGADVYVINSCAVTARAEQKCRQLARSIKRRDAGARVLVVGCQAQLGGEDLLRLGEIDAVLGNEEKKELDRWLPRVAAGEEFAAVARYRRGQTMAEEWIDDFGDLSRATIKVQEGCNMRCTFCAIWKARGPSRSRPARDVVEQAQRLAAVGYEEIVLAGVHIGHYGRDLDQNGELNDLLDMLLELVDENVRFRISSIDSSEVDLALAARLVREPRLCRYLHLPLQAGSNGVLRRMRRAYGVEYYERLVSGIGALDPDFGLGVDLIVGFPGETEAEFEEGLALLERLPIRFYHVFRYSDRPGTLAERMGEKVPGPVAAERSARLRALGARKRRELLEQMVGQTVEGIVEGNTDDAGRNELMLDNYATAWVEGVSGLEKRHCRIELTGIENGALLGRTVDTLAGSSQ